MAENHKEYLLKLAVDLLNRETPSQIETVDVDSTTYNDGSSSLTITVNRPAKEVEELIYDEEEAIEFINNELGEYLENSKFTIQTILRLSEDYMRSKGIIEG